MGQPARAVSSQHHASVLTELPHRAPRQRGGVPDSDSRTKTFPRKRLLSAVRCLAHAGARSSLRAGRGEEAVGLVESPIRGRAIDSSVGCGKGGAACAHGASWSRDATPLASGGASRCHRGRCRTEADARVATALAPGAQHDAVAILQKGAAFAGPKRQRLFTACGQFQQ